jgi:opacity protein-like surface antigen
MSILSSRSGLALVLAALCLGGRTADAQVAPVTYWMPNWPIGFGGTVGQSSNTYGDFPSFDGGDARGGVSYARYNFPNGWFVGGEGGGTGLSMNGLNQYGAFGNIRSLNYQGVQFGYNFQNAPLTVYAGFDTLKYTAGNGGPFASFDSKSGTLPGYSAHVGAEFQPAPNLSLSLGFGYTTQQSGRIDSDINSPLLPGASPFAVGGRR